VDELRRCLDIFGEVGAKWMNLHPDRHAPMHDRAFYIERNLQSLRELLPHAQGCGVGLMVENLPDGFNSPEQLSELLDPLPEIGLHIDIGHANLMTFHNTTGPLCARYGDRLKHAHLHDNKGGHADLHLPLGSGTLDVLGSLRALKEAGYDGTITLEVFTEDANYVRYSRDVLRRIWDEIA
jgi:sugar phosphate isomerase/epimerase